MAVETKYGSLAMNIIKTSSPKEKAPGAILGGRDRSVVDTVEVSAAASVASKYVLGQVPSNAVILPASKLHRDDLDNSANTPTLDIGLAEPDNTYDAALNNGIDAKTAGSTDLYGSDIANIGKYAWEMAGLSADPGKMFDVIVTIKDFAVDTGGTLSLELYYAQT